MLLSSKKKMPDPDPFLSDDISSPLLMPVVGPFQDVVVVYHVTIVEIGHGLLKKFWPLVIICCVYALQGVPLFVA